MEKSTKTVLLSLTIFIIVLSLFVIIRNNASMERQMPPLEDTKSANYGEDTGTDSWRKYLKSMAIREFDSVRDMPEAVLRDLDGNDVRVSEFKDKVVVIEFWSPTCFYCVKSMPHLEKLYNRFKDRAFVVLALTYPKMSGAIREFKREHNLTFPFLMDQNGLLFRFFKVRGIPHFVLVDKGKIIGDAVGLRDWYSEDAQALVEGMLENIEASNQ